MHSFAYENLDKERRISKSPEILSDNSKTIKKYENTGTPTWLTIDRAEDRYSLVDMAVLGGGRTVRSYDNMLECLR